MLTEKQTLKLSQLAGGISSSVRCCVLIFFKSKIIIALRYFKYHYKSSYQEKKERAKGIHWVLKQMRRFKSIMVSANAASEHFLQVLSLIINEKTFEGMFIGCWH